MTRVKSKELGVAEMYKFYKTIATPEKLVDFKMYKQIFYSQNKKISAKILSGHVYRCPYKLGYLIIAKKKMSYKIKRFDFGTYKKTGVKSNHTNLHSSDYIARWGWYKSKSRIKGKKAYSFVASRENKRLLAKAMKLEHRQFLER